MLLESLAMSLAITPNCSSRALPLARFSPVSSMLLKMIMSAAPWAKLISMVIADIVGLVIC